jgi:hypothetical protein
MEEQEDHHQTRDRPGAEAEAALMQMTEPTQVFDKVVMEEQELQLLYQDHQLLTLEAAEEQLNLVDQMDQAALEAAAQVEHQGKLERQIKAAEAALDLTQDHLLIQVAEQVDQVLLL